MANEHLEARQAVVNESGRQHMLTGFVRCIFCGGRVVGACLSGKYMYYRCRATTLTSIEPATCKARYIPAGELEEWVYNRLTEIVRDPEILALELEGHLLDGVGDTSGEIASLKREIRNLAEQQGRLMDQLGNDLIDQEILSSRIAPLKALYDEKRQLVRILEEQQRLRDDAAVIRERVKEYCSQLVERLDNLDFGGRRALLGVFGVRVEASRDDVVMTVVLDPRYANFTTIAQTLISGGNGNWWGVLVPCVGGVRIPQESEMISMPVKAAGMTVSSSSGAFWKEGLDDCEILPDQVDQGTAGAAGK